MPFTATYFGSIGLTLWFAIGVSSPRRPVYGSSPTLGACHRLTPSKPSFDHYAHPALPSTTRPALPSTKAALVRKELTLTIIAASKYHSHNALINRASRRSDMVSRQLLSHGIDRSTLCRSLRRQQSVRMDERLIRRITTLLCTYQLMTYYCQPSSLHNGTGLSVYSLPRSVEANHLTHLPIAVSMIRCRSFETWCIAQVRRASIYALQS